MPDLELDNLVNLTAHGVNVGREEIPPSGSTARIYYEQTFDHHVNGLPAYRNVNGWVKGLPAPKEGIGYIVSGIVFQSVLRSDLYTPNTQPWSVVHKEHGQAVKSVRSLICMPRVVA